MENKTIGGNILSSVLSFTTSTEENIPSSRVIGIDMRERATLESEISYGKDAKSGLEYFMVIAKDESGSAIASAIIEKDSGKIVKIEPQDEENRLKIFKMMFNRNMFDFSENCGMLSLDLVLCISMLYGNDSNLRLFLQKAYIMYNPVNQPINQSTEFNIYSNSTIQ